MFEIQTDRPGLFLREFSEDDAVPLFQLIDCNRGHLSRHDDTTSEKYPSLESVHRSIVHPDNPLHIRFGIWQENDLVGSINMTPQPDEKGSFEIGYWIGSEYCGNNIATLATRALIRVIKESCEAKKIVAYTHKDNKASQHVLLKSGLMLYQHNGEHIWFLRTL